MNTLTTAVDQWAAALTTGLGANKKAYSSAFGQAKSYWQAPMDKDLYDLAAQVNAKVTDATIRARGTAVMNAFPSVVLHGATSRSTPGRTASRSAARPPRTSASTSPTTGPSTSRCTHAGTTSSTPSCRSRRYCANAARTRAAVL
jgi:hypothetical protein